MNKQGSNLSPRKHGHIAKAQGQVTSKKGLLVQDRAMAAIAGLEHEIGECLYEFFFSCFNLILYHRGLHSKRLFKMRQSPVFNLTVPHMRFPETLVYLEKVTEKGVNLLMADYLDAFLFEERDRYGNSVIFMHRLHGFPGITPTALLVREEMLAELKSNCESLLYDLTRTLSNMPPVTQPNMFRWKIELGLKKVDKRHSKWKNNNQGIFIDDPDWRHFPWSRNARPADKKDDFQKSISPGVGVPSAPQLADDTNSSLKAGTSSKRSSSSSSNRPEEDCERNFQDVALEEDMGSTPACLQDDYESEGLSMIDYVEETEQSPGSPDMFLESSNSKPPLPVPATTEIDSSTSKSLKSPIPAQELEKSATVAYTLAQPHDPHHQVSPLGSADHDSSTEDFKDATNIFEDLEDFNYLDEALKLLEENDLSLDELSSSICPPKNPGPVKFYAVATGKLMDSLLCNLLVFQDIQSDGAHSDYKALPPKKKIRRNNN